MLAWQCYWFCFVFPINRGKNILFWSQWICYLHHIHHTSLPQMFKPALALRFNTHNNPSPLWEREMAGRGNTLGEPFLFTVWDKSAAKLPSTRFPTIEIELLTWAQAVVCSVSQWFKMAGVTENSRWHEIKADDQMMKCTGMPVYFVVELPKGNHCSRQSGQSRHFVAECFWP